MAIERITDNKFELVSKYDPAGDQGQAISELVENIENGEKRKFCVGQLGQENLYDESGHCSNRKTDSGHGS